MYTSTSSLICGPDRYYILCSVRYVPRVLSWILLLCTVGVTTWGWLTVSYADRSHSPLLSAAHSWVWVRISVIGISCFFTAIAVIDAALTVNRNTMWHTLRGCFLYQTCYFLAAGSVISSAIQVRRDCKDSIHMGVFETTLWHDLFCVP